MTAPLVALEAGAVDYRGRTALGPIDFAVEEGEIVSLVGPSGCGKSTLLRLLAGLESPTRGRATRRLGRGDTGVVFQAPTLMPWTSALDNVALGLRLAGVPPKAAAERARQALAQVGLSEAEGLRPGQLSGGMAMRASLARAIAARPRLLLLDEPFAALDELVRRRLADDVLSLWEATRPAVVFVTHNVEEAAYMAGRVVVLTPGPGRIAAEIRPPGPLPRPARFRADPGFREAAEQLSAALEAAGAAA